MADKTKQPFKSVKSRVKFPEIEEQILNFWQKNKIFEKSIEARSADELYSFYDGPPFVTGVPHYGSLLSSIAKDIVPRFWTMKGKRVRRVWGWDCHGLPIENKVENKLKIKRKKDIEAKIGVKKFIDECLTYVDQTSPEWKWYVDHVGRWVDFDHAYRTMDLAYMETVIWVFKQIYDQGLIYQGKRVSLFCPHCSTPVSNFEIAMDNSYEEITEPSNVYKYQLADQKNTYILAWSTTPWNKLVTPALAVNPDLIYVKVKQGNDFYILAKTTLKLLQGDYEIVDEFKGKKLAGIKFEPHYDFYHLKDNPQAFRVYPADFVTAEEGTGVVTIAAYGEEDYELMQQNNIPIVEHLDEEGYLKAEIKSWAGQYYLEVNAQINADLEGRGLMYRQDQYTHTVPVCWRCKTRLVYAPQDAWFIKVSTLKDKMLKNNQNINWVPRHFKHGRFQQGIENAPDWCISRSRYWGSPMPVWDCSCGQRYVVGSIKELEELSGQKVTNLHRPDIDQITIKCSKCGGEAHRVTDVLDCWLESGSMPYAERHYPFENKAEFEKSFPADFVSEYVAQTRAWFYVMHVVSTALFNSHSFKNVVVTGVIMGNDGRKMSKSYGNYPDPQKTLKKYGGDALRLYLLGSQLFRGQDINIDEREMLNALKTVIMPLWNIYRYLTYYANFHQYQPKTKFITKNILDEWLKTRLNQFSFELNHYLETYHISEAVRLIQPFLDDVSTWYIRRSRDRFVAGEKAVLDNLYLSLKTFVQLTAPMIPFITEEIYQGLKIDTDKESVHLCDYPAINQPSAVDRRLLTKMSLVREICSSGHGFRKEQQIRVRQPLAKARISFKTDPDLTKDLIALIQEELNVKQVELIKSDQELKVDLDTQLTPELKAEGEARDLIRAIQSLRKKQNCDINEKITVKAPDWPEDWIDYIKKSALVEKLVKGDKLEIIS